MTALRHVFGVIPVLNYVLGVDKECVYFGWANYGGSNSSDVFLAHTSDLSLYTGFFRHSGPTISPQHLLAPSFHMSTLPPPPRRHATVEEVEDEDDISILTHHSDASVNNDDPERELHATMERETTGAGIHRF